MNELCAYCGKNITIRIYCKHCKSIDYCSSICKKNHLRKHTSVCLAINSMYNFVREITNIHSFRNFIEALAYKYRHGSIIECIVLMNYSIHYVYGKMINMYVYNTYNEIYNENESVCIRFIIIEHITAFKYIYMYNCPIETAAQSYSLCGRSLITTYDINKYAAVVLRYGSPRTIILLNDCGYYL